jgi:hypothetical protein
MALSYFSRTQVSGTQDKRVRAHVDLGSETGVSLGKCDECLEFVAARLAFPEVPHTMSRQILGPFRQEDRLPALGAVI